MHADRFRRLVDPCFGLAQGPFISIYFDDSHDTADAGAQLDARLRDIRKNLEDHAIDAGVIEPDLPYLVPVVEHGVPRTTSLTVAVDSTGADISLHHGDISTQTVEGSSYGGPQGRVEESVRKNIREVAERAGR